MSIDAAIRTAVADELAKLRRDPPPPKIALTVAEAMKATGAGEATIRGWIRDGLLPKVPHTQRVLVPVVALEAFVLSAVAPTIAKGVPAPASPAHVGASFGVVRGPFTPPREAAVARLSERAAPSDRDSAA